MKLINRLIRWLVQREFVTAALKEGSLHLHRDPIRRKLDQSISETNKMDPKG